MDTYYWSSEQEHANNSETMSDFLNHEMETDCEILFVDGSYAEIKTGDGIVYAVHAGGDGSFTDHKVTFAQIY